MFTHIQLWGKPAINSQEQQFIYSAKPGWRAEDPPGPGPLKGTGSVMLMDAHIIKQRDKGPGSEGFVGTLQYADGPVLYRGWGRALGESTPEAVPAERLQLGVPLCTDSEL